MKNKSIVFIETLTNGYVVELLYIFSWVSILFGVLVVMSKNPMMSVLCLMGLYLSISSYLFMLGLQYMGLAYLLVYVGAVSILFLFILMLMDVSMSELFFDTSNSWPLASLMGVLFISIVGASLPTTSVVVAQGASPVWDGALWATDHIKSMGNVMYTDCFMWLMMTSIMLLLAMVGSIVMTMKPDMAGSLNKSDVLNM